MEGMDYIFAPLWLLLTAGIYTGVLVLLARPLLRHSVHLPVWVIRLVIYAAFLFISAVISLYITMGVSFLLHKAWFQIYG